MQTDTPSSRKYNLIVLHREVSDYFPGFRVPFDITYKDDTISTWRVCSSKPGVKIGENQGNYISKGIKAFFRRHENLASANTLTFRVNEPGKRYEIINAQR